MANKTFECGRFKRTNSPDLFQIGHVYNGVPNTLIINCVGWLILVGIFVFLRKTTFKYLKRRSDDGNNEENIENMMHMYFTSMERKDSSKGSSNSSTGGRSTIMNNNEVFEDAFDDVDGNGEQQDHIKVLDTSRAQLTRRNSVLVEDNSFWSWLSQSLFFDDSKMRVVAGKDAVQYLRFQRYLIGYILLTTILCICVVLPVNFQGSLQGSEQEFGRTTFANLPSESGLLYVHVIVGFLLFPISIVFMRLFSVNLKFKDGSVEVTKTLLIEGIPKDTCSEKILRTHFKEAYPLMVVKDVKIAYDVRELTKKTTELDDVYEAKIYCDNLKREKDVDLEMYPRYGGRTFSCCCGLCSEKVNAAEFYNGEEAKLKDEVSLLKNEAITKPLGLAFVTLHSYNDARKIFDAYQRHWHFCWKNRGLPMSSVSSYLEHDEWEVSFAPSPDDIHWQNLTSNKKWLTLKTILSNVILLIFALFLTTPQYIVSQLNPIINAMTKEEKEIPEWITHFLPTIVFWLISVLMPALVTWSVRLRGEWYRSEENHSVMLKTFWYLWIVVLVFPTFGLTTGFALLARSFEPGSDGFFSSIKWECIFLPETGGFFVNLIITYSLLGTGLELVRFPDLILYGFYVCLSRSKAEAGAVRRNVKYEFRFGEQYARLLLIFAMVMMYSLSCPLITVFGLLYFVLKYSVDKHNLAFVYAPSKMNKNVHRSAIHLVVFSVAVLQGFMTGFSFLRSLSVVDSQSFKTMLSSILLLLSIMIFSAQVFSVTCKRMSPIRYVNLLYADEEERKDDVDHKYIPYVLVDCYPYQDDESLSPTTAPRTSTPSGVVITHPSV